MLPEPPWQDGQLPDEDPVIAELSAIEDVDELCRRLLESPWSWGHSSGCAEVADLLAAVHGAGTLPDAFLSSFFA